MSAATVAALPDRRARSNPRGPCLADDRQTLDNAQFATDVAASAARLAAAGLGRGDVLAIMMQNRVEVVTSMFAAWRLGAAVTPVNPALTPEEARYQLEDANATLVVADGASAARLGNGRPVVDVSTLTAARAADAPPEVSAPDDLALLIYTSGTTGRPKGVMLDHTNITATAEQIVGWFAMDTDARCLLILPLFHVNGIMMSVVSPLLAGGSTVVAERFDAATFWATVGRARPTYFSVVPTILAMLLTQPETQPDAIRCLRFVICGAAPLPRALIAEFEQRYGVPLVEGYGLSECTVCCTVNPVNGVRKAGTVGVALPGVEVGVVDDDDQPLPVGAAGEVVVRGPNVMRGYLRRPEESAQTLRNGWLHTGDVGRFDEDGYLTLVDRVKDLIIRGGENIYPKEIENVLYAHPAVLEAAVIGRPDPVFGEEPVAFVALRPGHDVTADDIVEHGRSALARYKVPRAVFIEDALPKNAVGKISKPDLRARLRTGPAGSGGATQRSAPAPSVPQAYGR